MKKTKIIFLLIIIISLIVVMIFKSSNDFRIKPYMLIALLALSLIDGRVFARQRKKDKDMTTFLIRFVSLIALFYLLL